MARRYVDVSIHEPAFNLVDQKTAVDPKLAVSSIESIHTLTPLNYAYFSPQNVKIVQNAIRYEVYKRTNDKHVIGEQSNTELSIVMRSVYLQFGKNLPTNIPEQIQELNQAVVELVVPKIIVQIQQYEKYLLDISNPYKIMDRPSNQNVHGEKSFNMARFI
jgi:hypothetical protein